MRTGHLLIVAALASVTGHSRAFHEVWPFPVAISMRIWHPGLVRHEQVKELNTVLK